jgi:H+/gluconate symporter-like permease
MAMLADLIGLLFLIVVAYRGFSVILFAPLAAMVPLLLMHPSQVPEVFTGLYMDRTVYFVKLYFPVFLLGAVFGKLMELSGFAQSIIAAVIRVVGARRTIFALVMVCALLTYGGVSLFVVVFAVYPFAAEMFRRSNIPKRLIPVTIFLGGISFTMDAVPGTPQIQNIIPTTFFGTTAWAAPVLGCLGSLFIAIFGMIYIEWCVRRAADEGYGKDHLHEPETIPDTALVHPAIAVLPLIAVPLCNVLLARLIHAHYPPTSSLALPGLAAPLVTDVAGITSLWALEGSLLLAIAMVLLFAFRQLRPRFAAGSRAAVAGALLAALNTGSEYGFGAVIAALPGFLAIRDALSSIQHPLLNVAFTINALAGITGSASGGLSIALAAMAPRFIAMAHASAIPLSVLHRVSAMASGGMDALPHNGAIVTLLAVTGLTHRQSYVNIFVVTLIKTAAVFFVIGVYALTGAN